MGLNKSSSSFYFSLNYSSEAAWLLSNHLTNSSTLAVTVVFSSGLNLSFNFSSLSEFLTE